MPVAPDASYVVAALLLLAPVIAGPGGASPTELGEGSADLTVVSPTAESIYLEPGRFGTAAPYLRLPDLTVDASNLTGRPRVVYGVRIPALGVQRQRTRLLRDEGRLVVHMPDRAFEPPSEDAAGPLGDSGSVTGRLTVRVQSFTTDRTVVNRTVTVRERG